MIKRLITSGALIYLFFPAYSQIDTLQLPVVIDSLPIEDSIEVVTKDTLFPQPAKKQTNKKEPIYKLNLAADIPVTAIGAGWSIYAFTKIYNKGPSSELTILSLEKSNIPSFDRWAVRPYSKSLDEFSYNPFYAAMPLPLLFFLTGNEMRSDYLKLSLNYHSSI
jgi:hypothetical protein